MSELNLVEVTNLDVLASKDRPLIRNLNFKLQPGQAALVQGHNGSGKTTLMRTLLGVWPHFSGSFKIGTASEHVAYLPQVQSPELHLPMNFHDVLTTSSSTKYSKESLLQFGLIEKKHLSLAWNTGSGGEKKRALLTRIFLNRPELVFLDEPFNHLDLESHKLIGNCIKSFVEKGGAALIVSHGDQVSNFINKDSLVKVIL